MVTEKEEQVNNQMNDIEFIKKTGIDLLHLKKTNCSSSEVISRSFIMK